MSGLGDGARIVFSGVSKFYGDVLGVNRIDLALPSGVVALVGPNGSGKTTLLNLLTGLLAPTRGRITVLGTPTDRPEELGRRVGYCPQYDAFPRGFTARDLLVSQLGLFGYRRAEARERAIASLERVGLVEAADRRLGAYSKGMRQRAKLALALARDPEVLVLDEPLNGLDPLARAELMSLFRELAAEGRHLVLSSHILHEVDALADQVVLLHQGYVVADGEIPEVRSEIVRHPMTIQVRVPDPAELASRLFAADCVVEVRVEDDRGGLVLRTQDADGCFELLARLVVEEGLDLVAVAPVDENVEAVYQYLIGQRDR